MQNHLFEFNVHCGLQESGRSIQIRHLACQMFPSKPKLLKAAYEEETKDPYRYLFLDFYPISPEFARVRVNIFPYHLLENPCCPYLPKDMQI